MKKVKKAKIPFPRPIHFIEEKATTGMEVNRMAVRM